MMSWGVLTQLKKRTSTSADRSVSQRAIDMIGVTPDPAPTSSSFFGTCPGVRQNLPFGPLTSIRSPTRRCANSQLLTRPPGTRLTVISSVYGRVGVEEML